jgi:hypothetical protein
MKTNNSKILLSVIVLLGGLFPCWGRATEGDDVLLLSYFRGNGQAGIFLAASEDGFRFTELNDGKPIMKPAPWTGQNITRDPSMVYHDGTFYAVWTLSGKGRCFGYAESKDLVHWSDPVKVEPFPAHQKPFNMWAPEICWDPVQRNIMIFWSSAMAPDSQPKRIYVTRTADGKSFSPAKLFLDQKFSCIDGMMAWDTNNRPVLIFKNEDQEKNGGKNLRVATAPAGFSQPWTIDPKPIVGPGTDVCAETMTEGPSLLKMKTGWNLYWDAPLKKVYGMATSTDLKKWTDRTSELKMPPGIRHGTVFRAPRSAVGWLKNATGGKPPGGEF